MVLVQLNLRDPKRRPSEFAFRAESSIGICFSLPVASSRNCVSFCQADESPLTSPPAGRSPDEFGRKTTRIRAGVGRARVPSHPMMARGTCVGSGGTPRDCEPSSSRSRVRARHSQPLDGSGPASDSSCRHLSGRSCHSRLSKPSSCPAWCHEL
jgi:hypothetical protein